MKCEKCGNVLGAFDVFCKDCGERNSNPAKIVKKVKSKKIKTHSKFGELLISGSGKEYAKGGSYGMRILINVMIWLIVVASAIWFYFSMFLPEHEMMTAAAQLGSTDARNALLLGYVVLAWAIGYGIFIPVYLLMIDAVVKKTNIFVCEGGIVGVGAGKKLGNWDFVYSDTSSFYLSYEKISSIDVKNKYFLSINAYGRIYTVAVANPNAISEEINNRLYED